MRTPQRVAIPGSQKKAHSEPVTGPLDRNEAIEVTVRIRRKKSLEGKLKSGGQISHRNYEKEFGASQKDAQKVEAFASEHHLTTVNVDLARRSVMLSGAIADMESAFGVKLGGSKDHNGNDIRVREGEIFIPVKLKDIVEGVFGLDNRPLVRPMYKVSARDGLAAAPNAVDHPSYTGDQLADIYGFPKDFNGKGQTIAILEFGGGFRNADLTKYFKSVGIKKPSVKAVAVDKGKNSPSTAQSDDGEVMLDIEVAGAVAPGANYVVYFAPNTDKGFLDAITQAIHDTHNKPGIISISWGAAEVKWTEQTKNSMNESFKAASLLGVTICVAAGDAGSDDGMGDNQVHVDFPSSSPYVLACGGTSLKMNGNNIESETVWHDSNTSATGGGVSDFFPLPDYQKNANVPENINSRFIGRGVPDVAADADPATGYKVLVDGKQFVVGGTSAVAPLYAALVARVNQKNGANAGFINPVIYANPALCRDITEGNNNTTPNNMGYSAGPGWDACTGLGVLSGF